MSVDPASVALYIPAGLKGFKQNLFERIGSKLGKIIRDPGEAAGTKRFRDLVELPDDAFPIIGCSPELRPIVVDWQSRKRPFIYWDRGYARRVFATHLPRGSDGGYYRWHVNAFQMRHVHDRPAARWDCLTTPLAPWAMKGKHIVIAKPTENYAKFHGIESWLDETMHILARATDRQLVIRDKQSKRTLQQDLAGAHALVSHGSNAAVEAAILGCPVFVHPDSAASLIGKTDLVTIEHPIYPDRTAWARSLAYCQFSERELVNGVLWDLIS